MDGLSGMQQMFNELLDKVMDARQMAWIIDKDRSKFWEQAKALADELNSKKKVVHVLSDEVKDEQVIVTTLKKDIQDYNDTIELMQLMKMAECCHMMNFVTFFSILQEPIFVKQI